MELKLPGRRDIEDLFRISGILEYRVLNHTPFLAFIIKEGGVEVELVNSAEKLLQYPDDTRVLVQWRGKWRSDYFNFSVGELKAFNEKERGTNGPSC